MDRTPCDLLEVTERVFTNFEESGWAGRDPYDALLSPFARRTRSKIGRQVWTQLVKRSPWDLRQVLRIPSVRTAAGMGMAASACSRLGNRPPWGERARQLASTTLQAQLEGEHAGLWGYEFDVQTRWAFYPQGSPNIVATTFAADGISDADGWTAGRREALGRALLRHLHDGNYFVYTPGSRTLIHNANLMGAWLAMSCATVEGLDPALCRELEESAQSAAAVSVSAQSADGSWSYGNEDNLAWVDGFHTAYVLLRLEGLATLGVPGLQPSIDRGARFYFQRLFDGGTPLYSREEPGRRDANNAATAVRMAAWGAARGYVSWSFAEHVFAEVAEQGWMAAATGDWHPRVPATAVSPRWLGAPMLDALSVWLVEGVRRG